MWVTPEMHPAQTSWSLAAISPQSEKPGIVANDGTDFCDDHPARARADGDPLGAGVGGRSEVDEVDDLHLLRCDLRHRTCRVALVVCDPNISVENCNSD